jgi:hypothetical protein
MRTYGLTAKLHVSLIEALNTERNIIAVCDSLILHLIDPAKTSSDLSYSCKEPGWKHSRKLVELYSSLRIKGCRGTD